MKKMENEESYRPSVISIGPIYFQDPQLQTTQPLKWIFLECFIKHPKNACVWKPGPLHGDVKRIRRVNCYQQQQQRN